MADKSAIEWTDATWNPVRGCTKVSPGRKHCYAETFAERFRGVPGHAYERGFDPRFVAAQLNVPLDWKKPRRIFVNSMSDLFHEAITFEEIAAVFGVMAQCPQHTFQVLTKRAERMRDFFRWISEGGEHDPPPDFRVTTYAVNMGWDGDQLQRPWPLPNVWLGVSIENQEYVRERIPDLFATPAAVRFVSAEPLLGPLDLDLWLPDPPGSKFLNPTDGGLHWVIVGGESGRGARDFRVSWARSLVAQCAGAGVPCFVKQLGSRPVFTDDDRDISVLDGYAMSNEDSAPTQAEVEAGIVIPLRKKGGDWSDWPEDLRVRQFPTMREVTP